MVAFVIRRLLQSVLVMLAVGFIAFALFNYIGDPVLNMLGLDYTEQQRIELTRQLGLDQPFFVRFANYMLAALQGELGVSYRLARRVDELILERLPATL